MLIGVAQLIGVFVLTLYGVPTVLKIIRGHRIPASNFVMIAAGAAMVCSRMFF